MAIIQDVAKTQHTSGSQWDVWRTWQVATKQLVWREGWCARIFHKFSLERRLALFSFHAKNERSVTQYGPIRDWNFFQGEKFTKCQGNDKKEKFLKTGSQLTLTPTCPTWHEPDVSQACLWETDITDMVGRENIHTCTLFVQIKSKKGPAVSLLQHYFWWYTMGKKCDMDGCVLKQAHAYTHVLMMHVSLCTFLRRAGMVKVI